jgi:type II secretory pathway pseudopilin PulG
MGRYWPLRISWTLVAAALLIAIAIVLAAGIILGWWSWKTLIGWRALVGYINPTGASQKKEALQVYAVIVAGVIASITAAVGLANLRLTRKNLEQQRVLEAERAQEDALQSYFEQMGDLLTDHNLINTEREDIRQLARSQTITVLARLNGPRRGSLIRFLDAAGLMHAANLVVGLSGADLRYSHLRRVNLRGADLRGADLSRADLSRTDLREADLRVTSLREADVRGADVRGADLRGADLSGVHRWTKEQLAEAKSLGGAIMPNGQTYEDWLKDRENRKDG